MKQNYFKSLFLMLMMLVGMGAWAEEVTFTFSDVASELTWENGVAQTNVTLDNFTFTVNGGGNNGKYYTSDFTWRFYSGGGLSITPADGYIITDVTSNPSQSFTVSNGTATTSFSATVKFKSITIKYTTTGGSTTDPTTTYNVTIASNITGGSIKANPASAVAGTKITLNATPNEGYEFGGWNVTGATVADASSPETTFTMPAANVNVSAKFNKQIVPFTTINEIFASASAAGSTAKEARVTFNNWVVSAVKNNNAYVTDNAGKGFIIYTNGHGFEVGDILSGTAACKIQLYNGSAELTNLTSTTEGLTVTKGGVITPVTNLSIADLSGINTGALVSYEGLEYNGTSFTTSDGATLKPYNTFITLPTLVNGKAYNVTGIYIQYLTTKEIAPRTAEDFELIEILNNYIVFFDTTENGTIVVKNGKTVINDGDEVAEGTVLTIECTPASEDYRFKNWQYKAGDAAWATRTTDFTYTMPSANVQFRANFEEIPTYAIAWSVNGTVVKTDNVKEGAAVNAPEVEAINGKVFTGWVATETIAADATPAYVTPTTADKDATYYAVFASVEGEGGEAMTHELSQQQIASAYVSSGDNKTTSYGNYEFGAGWSGSCLINKYSEVCFVQIRKNTANNYILTPDFGYAVSSITINTTAAGSTMDTPAKRQFYLCQTNETAQPTSGDYGTGAITENNGSVTINVTGDPHQFYIYANGGAYIKSIIVNYGGGTTYSDFTTTVSAPVTKYNVTISDDIENGTVTVDKETAAEGETVTLTITPEDGYALAQLMVCTDYDDVDVEGNTFVMPASDVEVYAYFAPASSETYTLSELAEADIEPYSVVSVSFNNEIVDIQMDEEEGGYIALKDGDNTFVLQTYYACNAEWTAGGTLSGTWENVYYAEQGGAYILMNDSDEPWAGLTYTAPVAPTNGTLTFKAQNEDGYWATFSCDKDVIFDANDVVVYTVAVDDKQIVMIDANNNSLSCVTDKTKDGGWVAGYYVQAGAAVLINSVDESVNYYFIDTDPFTSNDLNEVETDPEYNMLVPCTSDGIFKAEADGNMYYKLAYGDNTNKTKLGFWWGAEDGSANFKVKAGGAVLCVPQATATSVKGFSFDMANDQDAIKGIEQKTLDTVIYDMQGRKVSKTQKGLYIVNGRKMVK